jgi:hypothetical protein
MEGLPGLLSRWIRRGICPRPFLRRNTLLKQSADSKPRYIRARRGRRQGVYRVLEERVDHHRGVVKRYRRLSKGLSRHLDEGPDEWIVVRRQGTRSGNEHNTGRAISPSERVNADSPRSRTSTRISRRGPARAQGVDSVAVPPSNTTADDPRRRRARPGPRTEHSVHHKTRVRTSRRLLRQDLQSATQQQTIMAVEDHEETDVTDTSSPNETNHLNGTHSTTLSSGDSRQPRLTSPFQQPQMTTRQSQTMVFGMKHQMPSESSVSRDSHTNDMECVTRTDDGLGGQQRSRPREVTAPEDLLATLSEFEQLSMNDDQHG